ncbi:MAG: uroporphyrinogen decarboxylase [Deferribacteraceae bacterium]|jgi:uroporphyrinogen decarboxylase|nr:uroporphyrinogen decarboxylase [Deferribacteraceae bacterium]
MAFNSKLLSVLEGAKPPTPPIWLMRQAGRYMPEYRAVREKVSFLELCKSPELACEVTLQPVELLGVDAAILFSDILVPIEPMGAGLDFNPAPVIKNPVRDLAGAERLKTLSPLSDLPFLFNSIRLLKARLEVPLIGFCGAPFTLACYLTEGRGSKDFLEIKKLMYSNTHAYRLLMEKLTDSMIRYLQTQIDAGADAVQIFDTWAGVLSPSDYGEFVVPYLRRLTNNLKGAPVIYFAKAGAGHFRHMKGLSVKCIGVDWTTDLELADELLERRYPLQGNLDPAVLLSDPANLIKAADAVIDAGRKLEHGHIFNLGHGILPSTPTENVKALIRHVQWRE